MENTTEIDWENDPIMTSELDEKIRIYLQSQENLLPDVDLLFDECTGSSLSTPSEFSVDTPSSTALTVSTRSTGSGSPVKSQCPKAPLTEVSVQTESPTTTKSTTLPTKINLNPLQMPPPKQKLLKRPASTWESPAEKRMKYESKLTRYTAKKQMYFERFRSMKNKLRKLQIPNSLPPDVETIKLFDEVSSFFHS